MKSIYTYISFYVRSLEKERDELLNRLLEANRIRPLYDYGATEGTVGAEAPKEPIQAYPMGQQRALNELSRLSRDDAKRARILCQSSCHIWAARFTVNWKLSGRAGRSSFGFSS